MMESPMFSRKRKIKGRNSYRYFLATTLLIALTGVHISGCGDFEEADQLYLDDPEEFDQRRQSLGEFCTVNIRDVGMRSVEEDYLPKVLACENNNAPMESLKAQAIAARTYAVFITRAENRPIWPTTRDQAYICANQVEQRHIDAVNATRGQVLTHNGRLTAAFYVAGATPQAANSCRAVAGDNDWSNTERRVTYNENRTGGNVRATTLGSLSNPANRGAKSQNGSNCLANQGWSHERILRFYYGDDIRVTQLGGSCVGEGTGPAPLPQPQDGPATGHDAPTCETAGQRPAIVERSEWGARPPRRGFGTHTPNRLSIHHTDSYHNASNPSQAIRNIQSSHQNRRTRNGTLWTDIGYHFLIDHNGTIYRGRGENHIGAHVPAANTGNLGIALIGRYDTSMVPPEAQLKAAAQLIRYLSDKHNIAINRDRIKGHGEQSATACPGRQLRDRLDSLLQMAQGDAICDTPEERILEGPQIEIEESSATYRYVRVRGVSAEPVGTNADLVPGFEVDAVGIENSQGSISYASSVSGSSGVSGGANAVGTPNNTTCENRPATVAGVSVGGELILDMGQNFGPGDLVHVIQHSYLPADADCTPSGSAEIAVSADRNNWVVLANDVAGNFRQTLAPPSIRFAEPGHNARVSPNVRLRARTSGPIVRVEYFAEQFELGGSSDASTRFFHEREFNVFGRRLLTAIGYDSDNRPIAKDEIEVTVVDGFSFLSPRHNGWYSPAMWLKVSATSAEITRVTYEADGFAIDESTDRAGDFAIRYEFNTFGTRNLTARGFNAQGQEVSSETITIEIAEAANEIEPEFVSPQPGGWYTPGIWFKTDFGEFHDIIATVQYYAEEFLLGGSADRDSGFALRYEFNTPGMREIRVVAKDSDGNVVSERTISIVVTDEDGNIPAGALGAPPGISGNINTAVAERLATEAGKCSESTSNPAAGQRCTNGVGGPSIGRCWAYVWGAMIRAELTTFAGADRLANSGPCSSNTFYRSAFGFRCNADANPSVLSSTFGLERIDVPVTQAPRGAVVGWDRGCLGYHATHGHIEISMGNGILCSDFCGQARGDAACASVYVPVH